MKLFNHVQIKVESLEKSKQFYDAIFASLGFGVVLHIKNTVIGYGTSVNIEAIYFDKGTVPFGKPTEIIWF